MQPVVKAALLCDYAMTSEDGKLSAVGIFSNVNFTTLPSAYPRFFVVLIVNFAVGSHSVRISIMDPMGQDMLPEPPQVDIDVDVPGADTNLVIDFNNLPFNRPGIYQVQLFVEGLLVHSMPLTVQGGGVEGMAPVRAN